MALNALLAMAQLETVLLASTDLYLSMDLALFYVVKTSSASVASVWLVHPVAMVAPTILRTVSTALVDMSELAQFVRKDAFPISSTTTTPKAALPAQLHAPPAHLLTTVPHAKVSPLVLEVVSAQIALILAPLVMEPVLALLA